MEVSLESSWASPDVVLHIIFGRSLQTPGLVGLLPLRIAFVPSTAGPSTTRRYIESSIITGASPTRSACHARLERLRSSKLKWFGRYLWQLSRQ